MTAWKVLHTHTLLDRRWLRVRQQHVVLPNGEHIEEFHLIDSADWAAVLALTEDRRAILVEQYRHGLGTVSLELPAGAMNSGEAPLDAAQRELLEETGYVAQNWWPLLTVSPEPSRHTHSAFFFVAYGARTLRPPNPDATEVLSVRLVAANQLVELAATGGIGHGVHVGPILLAAQRGWLDP